MLEYLNGVNHVVYSNVRTELDQWLEGAPAFTARYGGDDGRPLSLDEHPFWTVDMQVAAKAEWDRLQATVADKVTAETVRRGG